MHCRPRVEKWGRRRSSGQHGSAVEQPALACGDEEGSVTVEFALVVPAVVLLLAGLLGAIQIGVVQVRLTDAAADAARLLGRGEPTGMAAQRVATAQAGATMSVDRSGALVCVTATASASATGLGALLEFAGRGCALDDAIPATAGGAS